MKTNNKLTPVQQHLLDKLPLDPQPKDPEMRRNPYSGVSHLLDPLAIVLHDFIVNAIGVPPQDTFEPARVHYKGHTLSIKLWHHARMLFRELWPDEYMDLID